jgi:hypothetical protein
VTYNARETGQYSGSPVELYRFVHGSQQLFFTSADKAQTYSGNTYVREAITRGEIDASDEDQQGMLEVTLPRTNAVADLFIPAMPTSPVILTLFRMHRGDAEVVQLSSGEVFERPVRGLGGEAQRPARGKRASAHHPSTTFQGQCNWALYSTQCGIAKATYAEAGTVSAIAGAVVTLTITHDRASGYFNNGFVVSASNERHWILGHTRLSATSAQLTLMTPFAALQAGDTLTGVPRVRSHHRRLQEPLLEPAALPSGSPTCRPRTRS